jgi:hypothetical protein
MSLFVVLVVIAIVSYAFFSRLQRYSRQKYIRGYRFHPAIKQKLKGKHPQLRDTQLEMIFDGLRDYFHICNQAKGKMVSMPSQAVDDAWHEFILFTLIYQRFCAKGLGRFLHHTPAEAMRSPVEAQIGIKRAWQLACVAEGLSRRNPTRLPRLFAIDALLNLENGFIYSLNCRDRNSPYFGSGYCATHIGCTSDCAGSSSDCSGCSGGGGDGSGCGGD